MKLMLGVLIFLFGLWRLRLLPIRNGFTKESSQHRYAVVSGGTGGTGKAVIAELYKHGMEVIILHRQSSFVGDEYLHLAVDYNDLSDFGEEFANFLDKSSID